MLTLTRKSGECIRIGDDIRIVIREIKGRQVRIGVEAPLAVQVYREEIYLKIQDEEVVDPDLDVLVSAQSGLD